MVDPAINKNSSSFIYPPIYNTNVTLILHTVNVIKLIQCNRGVTI